MDSILRYLERRLNRFAIPHLTVLLVIGQSACYVFGLADPRLTAGLMLDPGLILQGEIWRLATFLFIPPNAHPVFIFFALYLFWLMGSALEHEWGEFRYNLYYFVGYLATLAVGFFVVKAGTTNIFLMTSVFLAFAYLYPNFELYLFFILPVKVKWLALITWIGYGLKFLLGGWQTKVLIAAACANFLAFFGADIVRRVRLARRRMAFDAAAIKTQPGGSTAFHTCAVCGLTEKDDPKMDFRVCLECSDGQEYCRKHLPDHEHV